MRAIINGKIVLENEILENKVILFDEKIREIIDNDCFENNKTGIEIIDAEDKYISPGFIDMHIHGSAGADVMDGTVEAIMTIGKTIASNGVTGFLPTTMTMNSEKIYTALNCIKDLKGKVYPGAEILGAHLEGPFINAKYKGAQKEDYILKPDFEFVKDYLDIIKLVTIAPEMDDNHLFIKKVKKESSIVISMGHSNANYDEAKKAIEDGVSYATHIFNAMTPLNHRNPGVVGAVLDSDVYCELIADKIHVNPSVFRLLKKVKTPDKLLLITDSMRAGCLRDGESELGGQKVIVKDNSARLEDGTLAGSILRLNEGARNFKENTDASIVEIIKMISYNPAKNIGVLDRIGSIDINKDSNLVIFDENFNIMRTIREGLDIYKYDYDGGSNEINHN